MADYSDPRVTDEATGLPPLDEIGEDEALFVCAWVGGEGIVNVPDGGEPIPVRYLHLRGLAGDPGENPVWAQVHIAVPVKHAVEVAVALATGGWRQLSDTTEAASTTIPPGTPPPKVSAEVWGKSSGEQWDVTEIADIVRINDTWHVVAIIDD